MSKLTKWYHAEVAPVRPGWYDVQCKVKTCAGRHYWTGQGWSIDASDYVNVWACPWRGLRRPA